MTTPHKFSAYLRDEGYHTRHWVAHAESFVDAAVRFAEGETVHGEMAIIVTDNNSGISRCFLVNADSGELQTC